jgi:uncharacterized repeat protein (TIGR01451 family)
MRTRVWCMSLVLASLGVACGDQPTEVVPEREMTHGGGMIAAATSSSDDGLSITTDKDDYAPGDTVWFTGAGWPANDTLNILLEDEPATHEPHAWSVMVEEDGAFRDSTYVVDVEDVGVTFTLTATSRATGRWLKVQFTDGNVRVAGAPAGVTFTVTRTVFSVANCGGSVTLGPNDIVIAAGTNPTVASAGGTGPPSVRLVAAATSAAGATFNSWSSSKPFSVNPSDNKSICLNGDNGNLDFVATYNATPDLVVTKGTSGDFKVASSNARYTFEVENDGSATAEGTSSNRITVTDLLPAGITPPASPFTQSNWACTVTGQSVTCQLSPGQTILPGAERTFSFSVGITLDACPSVTNSATVSGGNEPAANTGNNTSADVNTPITDGCPDPNHAPSANAGPNKTGNEGSAIQLDGSGSTDPDGDTPLTFEWTVLPLSGFDAGATCDLDDAGLEKPSITCTDDGVVKVTLQVKDSKGLPSANVDEVEVTVENVKPTVTVSPGSKTIAEGGTASFTAQVIDPGANDNPADFDFAWTTTVAPCSPSGTPIITGVSYDCNDNAAGTVKLSVDDGDANGQAFDEATLTVTNVAPTASGLTTNSPIPEGSDIVFSLTGVFDPSTVDAASLKYAFYCGVGDATAYQSATYATAGGTNSATCSTTDNGTRTVKGKVFDKDGDSNEYTESVTITNVRPTITSILTPGTGDPLPTSIFVNGTVDMEVEFDDPGTDDTHKAQVKCSPDNVDYADVDGSGDDVSPFTTSCTFATVGAKTIYVKVTDDDGGYDVETRSVMVTYDFDGFYAPVDRPNTMNVSKAGQAIPLKWTLRDANGDPVTDLVAVTIKTVATPCVQGNTTDPLEEYANSTSGLLNLGDGRYQYNWKTPANYAGTCKSIALVFGSGGLGYTEGPHALFSFKK